ncbi:MAG: DUF4954 family protein [Candidatus Sumerlaeia bacterium]|nr:DUF4954 family protein [Candidatus Sumerlaeia bacterium]
MDEHIESLFKNSEVVQTIRHLRSQPAPSMLFGDRVKPLTAEQIARLKLQGCEASDWGQIYAVEGFDGRSVSHTRFDGRCVLGRFSEKRELPNGHTVPSGIYNATLVNCEIGNNAVVRDVAWMANTVVAAGASVVSVAEITASAKPTFGNGIEIALGLETGERAIRAMAELDLSTVDFLVRELPDSPLRQLYRTLLHSHLEAIALGRNYIGPHASIRVCRRLHDVFIGTGAVLEGATAVINTTVLSSQDEVTRIGDGAIVRHSLMQWGSEATTGAIVENSLLAEHSHVEQHGKVSHSFIGPNTGVGKGEVNCSLLGPFVGFHHQALLIATLWPSGKGNVGYGANVGSNHTSKAPDQELWAGEGMFFGLGVNVKFPANFSAAPYTIIATGLTLLPQKLEFPFSLINSPNRFYEGISPAYNEILPGWVLRENLYALARNETKYRERNRARKCDIEFAVLRPETIDMVIEARQRLMDAPKKEPGKSGDPVVYLEKDIPGLGKNYLLEASRIEGIEAYTFALRFYALRAFYQRLLESGAAERGRAAMESVLTDEADSLNWAHALDVLAREFPKCSIQDLLELWVTLHRQYAEGIRLSKARDDERGTRIIPDYAQIHPPADKDKTVMRAATEQTEIEKRVAEWLKR